MEESKASAFPSLRVGGDDQPSGMTINAPQIATRQYVVRHMWHFMCNDCCARPSVHLIGRRGRVPYRFNSSRFGSISLWMSHGRSKPSAQLQVMGRVDATEKRRNLIRVAR
jgi:hypothetical protein